MIHRINVFLLSIIIGFLPAYVFASSAPKVDPWRYEPARKAGTSILDVIADRTVQRSVLDKVADNTTVERIIEETERRKTQIDTAKPEIKKAMGSTMRNRIFNNVTKGGLWGIAAAEAMGLLLEGVGWVIDPETQSIWRNKPDTTNNGSTNPEMTGCKIYDADGYQMQFRSNAPATPWASCPIDAVYAQLKARQESQGQNGRHSYAFVRWERVNYDFKIGGQFGFVYKSTYLTSTSESSGTITGEKTTNKLNPPEKETLTDEKLADYMTGKAPDSPQPDVWTGVEDVFKPENNHERENAPTVKQVEIQLENAPNIIDETDTKTDVDTKPDGSGFNLPKFCSWATAVCDFISWSKSDGIPDKDTTDLDVDNPIPTKTVNVNFGASCPPPVSTSYTLRGHTSTIPLINFDPLCAQAPIVKPSIIALASIGAAFIIFGRGKSE